MKIFVSHHNDDAGALSHVKDLFKGYDVDLFLAHEDIRVGEHDLNRIKEEISACDIFLFIGGKKSEASVYCNQELGMAIGKGKTILSAIAAGMAPWGFIARLQAIKYQSIENSSFFDQLLSEALAHAPGGSDFAKKRKALKSLGVEGFSTKPDEARIFLRPDFGWNDFGYRTAFEEVRIKGVSLGKVRIAYSGQMEWLHTAKKLPSKFPFLGNAFFSRFLEDDGADADIINSIKYLLNDVDRCPEFGQRYWHEGVFKHSIYRDEKYQPK